MKTLSEIKEIINYEKPSILEAKELIKQLLQHYGIKEKEEHYDDGFDIMTYIVKIELFLASEYETAALKKHTDKLVELVHLNINSIKTGDHSQKIRHLQLMSFYKIFDSKIRSIENMFHMAGYESTAMKLYISRKKIRKQGFIAEKKYGNYLGYIIWELTSNYGDSFFRWGITSFLFIVSFGALFYFIDPDQLMGVGRSLSFFDYIYFSTVTFTTLGYGDIIPANNLQQIFVMIEVFSGYIMLGLFLTFLQNKTMR